MMNPTTFQEIQHPVSGYAWPTELCQGVWWGSVKDFEALEEGY